MWWIYWKSADHSLMLITFFLEMGRCAQSKSGGRLTCGRNKDCGASAKPALSDTVDPTREDSSSASLQDVSISA